jgi:hypothetical protein
MDLLPSPLLLSRAPRPLEANLAPLVAGPMQGVRSGWTWANRTGAGRVAENEHLRKLGE